MYVLGRQHEGRKLIEGRRFRCENNIKIDVKQIERRGIFFDSSFSGQEQLLGCGAHKNEPSFSIFADWVWSCWLLQKHCDVCSLLFTVFEVRRAAYSGVLCVVPVCVHSAALQHLLSCVLYRFVFTQCCLTALESCVSCIVPVFVHSAALQHLQSCVLCVVPVCLHTVLPYSIYST